MPPKKSIQIHHRKFPSVHVNYLTLLWCAFMVAAPLSFLLGTQTFHQQRIPVVVDAEQFNDLKAVTFDNGTTELLYRDYDYAHPELTGWDIRTIVNARTTEDKREPSFQSPEFFHQGDIHPWDHDVFTSNTPNSDKGTNILFIDRIKKTATYTPTPWNIIGPLDKGNITRFLGFSIEDNATTETGSQITIAIGTYNDGKALATHVIPNGLGFGNVESNWENTKLLIMGGACDLNEDTRQVYLWNTLTDSFENKTPENFGCGNESITYHHDTDSFTVTSDGQTDIIIK